MCASPEGFGLDPIAPPRRRGSQRPSQGEIGPEAGSVPHPVAAPDPTFIRDAKEPRAVRPGNIIGSAPRDALETLAGRWMAHLTTGPVSGKGGAEVFLSPRLPPTRSRWRSRAGVAGPAQRLHPFYKFRALARESHATLVAVDEAIVCFNHGVAFWPQFLRPGPVLLDSMLASPRSPLSLRRSGRDPRPGALRGTRSLKTWCWALRGEGPLVKHQPHEEPFKYPGIGQVVPGTLGKWLQGSRTSPMGRTKGPSRAGRVDPARQRSHRA